MSLRGAHGCARRVEELAAGHGITPNHLVQILIELKANRIVKSVRGKQGGYLLARSPGEITLGDILRAMHGQVFDTPALADGHCASEIRSACSRLQKALENIADNWQRTGVAADLANVSVRDPFGVLSLFVGGPAEMTGYAGGAAIQTDDRMALEFTGPFAVNTTAAADNVAILRRLLDGREQPPAIAHGFSTAGAAEWRQRAAMMLKADAYTQAYDNYARALMLDPTDSETHAGFVRAAVAAGRNPSTRGSSSRLRSPKTSKKRAVDAYRYGRPSSSLRPTMRTKSHSMS